MGKIVLGRDGMGLHATEDDFDSWVAFVSDRVAKLPIGGLVSVETRERREVQDDAFRGDEAEREMLSELVRELWDAWCSGNTE